MNGLLSLDADASSTVAASKGAAPKHYTSFCLHLFIMKYETEALIKAECDSCLLLNVSVSSWIRDFYYRGKVQTHLSMCVLACYKVIMFCTL